MAVVHYARYGKIETVEGFALPAEERERSSVPSPHTRYSLIGIFSVTISKMWHFCFSFYEKRLAEKGKLRGRE